MPVKVGKLWSQLKFQRLSPEAKLLYLYLVSNTSLSTVGVFCPNMGVVGIELSLTLQKLREATTELIDNNYCHVKGIDGIVYYIVPQHFTSIPKSQSTVKKVQSDLDLLPKTIVDILSKLGIEAGAKVVNFDKPTPEEVTQYGATLGYNIDGKEFCDYYEAKATEYGRPFWVDGRGTQVRNWKAKLSRVWCKEENKLLATKGAPKGFEFFSVDFSGKKGYPDGWRDGKPYSKNLALDIKLKEAYDKEVSN